MDVLQGRKGAVSPVSRVLSSQSRVLLACSLGFFPQTRDLGSLGTEGHPRGSRGGAGADLADSPVPGGGTWVPGSGLGLSLQGCAEWSGAPHPQPQAQPFLQLPNQRQRGGRPLTLPPGPTLTLHPATLPSPARCPPGPSSPPALASAHPQPRRGTWCWSVPVSSRRGLRTLLPGQHLASRGLGGEQAALGRAVTADPLLGGSGNSGAGPVCLSAPDCPSGRGVFTGDSLGSRRTRVTENP